MSASDFFKKLQPLFESAETPKQEEPKAAEPVLEGEAAMAKKYAKFLKESVDVSTALSQLAAELKAASRQRFYVTLEDDRVTMGATYSPDAMYKALDSLGWVWDGSDAVTKPGSPFWLNVVRTKEPSPYNQAQDVLSMTLTPEFAPVDEEVVTELSPNIVRRVSARRMEDFENATDDWEAIAKEPEHPAFAAADEKVDRAFNKLRRNHRLAQPKK